ncbi:trigger factor isoform X2 [Oryza brachyantha]|uniref:trigger factor isoform X2 n=1 Tax=Oryza brachyantha TaxID=4533 RepID=UPI0007763666|nr:trigger factor isoform X2 [Oryza brachyantha]
MELSSFTASSLAAPAAAMGLLAKSPKMINHRINHKSFSVLRAVSPVQCTVNNTQSSISFKDFLVSVQTEEDGLIKIRVTVDDTMTDSFFEKVFLKKLVAAQPLPGFRRMKGGKTRDIPKDIALHIIGPSKVKKESIKNIISFTIAEYVQKEGLSASKNLKVLQSYEELEAAFEPGKEFCFDASLRLQ